MRHLKHTLAAALLAGLAAWSGAQAAPATPTRDNTERATAARAQVCVAQHSEAPDYLFKAWTHNHCSTAPTGRYDDMTAAWQCLCLY